MSNSQRRTLPVYDGAGNVIWENVAATVLSMCRMASATFPKPDVDVESGRSTASVWGYIFSKRPDYPPKLWFEAVGSFYGSEDAAGGRNPGVQDIVRHARIKADKEPFKSELRAIRARRVEERDRMLALGRAKQAALPKPPPTVEVDSMVSFSSAAKEIITRARMQHGEEGSF